MGGAVDHHYQGRGQQDYVDGLSLNEVIEQGHKEMDTCEYVYKRIGSDLKVQLSLLGAEFLTSLFQADYVMSDPHPGNIILLPGSRVALIDFGLVEPAPIHRSAFLGMVSQYRLLYEGTADVGTLAVAMMAFYDFELYEALMALADSGNYARQVSDYVSRAFEQRVETHRYMYERRITQLFYRYLNADNRFGIKVDERDIVLQKAMHNFLASVRMAAGDRYHKDRYHGIIHTSLVAAETEAYRLGIRESRRKTSPMKLEQAQDIIIDWLSVVADRDRSAYQALTKGTVS